MLRGCVAHPRLARILQGTASWNWRNFSMAAISDDVLGRLNCCVRPLCTADHHGPSSATRGNGSDGRVGGGVMEAAAGGDARTWPGSDESRGRFIPDRLSDMSDDESSHPELIGYPGM